ncbi:UDP-glucose/GDP-mannose dehydrogenase family protein [Sesbania bispinosa]|nr:UDP-glucose/GDP-mannose dehydrogenase family protein [Sesbania bispinosa]
MAAREKSVRVTLLGRSLRRGNRSRTFGPRTWHKAEGLLGGVELAEENGDITITEDFNVAVENVDG